MQKAFGLLFIVVLIWAGMEWYTKGEAAFGGIFADGEIHSEDVKMPGQAAGERLRAESEHRFDRMQRTISE